MTMYKFVILIPLVFVTISCSSINYQSEVSENSYLPASFSTENIMKVHPGMSSDEIKNLFGVPKNIGQAVCGGGENSGEAWNCITWEYGKYPYDRASFTFNGSGKKPVLNSFDIDKEGSDLPNTFTSENVMKVKQGMSSKKILEMFGFPVSVNQSVCGGATGEFWICTTWEYGKFPYDRASFSFSGKHSKLLLNSFKVEKD